MTEPSFTRLEDIPRRWRARGARDPAVITPASTLSAGNLADLVDAQASAVATVVPPGARVAVRAANSAQFVALLYSIPASGRVLVPLNTRLGDAALADQLRRTATALLLGDPVSGFDGPRVALDDLAGDGRETTPAPAEADGTEPASAREVAWIIFTSGSTGRPKGVCLTHASLGAAVDTTAAARPLADDEVYAYPFPLFHVAAYNVIHAHARRRPVILPDRFDPARLIGVCHEHGVTAISLAATMLRMVLDALADDPDLTPPPTLRTIAYGAAPMPEALLREAAEVLGCDFAQGYGMTELSGNAVFLPPEAHRRGLTAEPGLLTAAGWPGPGVDLRIVGTDGREVPCGEAGEIVIRGDQVCAGYLDDPTATATTIRDGWLHTGDIGTVRADGLLRIVDRAKDVVVTGGENVASRAVEDALGTHPAVRAVAVIGTPHRRWGEAVTAVVVPMDPDPGADAARLRRAPDELAEALAAHVGSRLAGYCRPRRVLTTGALPVNANGKVDKPFLRRAAAELIADW